jgi:hypothetical protein
LQNFDLDPNLGEADPGGLGACPKKTIALIAFLTEKLMAIAEVFSAVLENFSEKQIRGMFQFGDATVTPFRAAGKVTENRAEILDGCMSPPPMVNI